jgi:protein-disulfide isomerase
MRILLATFLLVLAQALAPPPAGAQGLSEPEVERIVRDYLMREPEIILEAIEALQRRQQEAEAERRRGAIARLEAEIFRDPVTPVIGNPDGDVTLVEFMDYRCGFCRRMVPAIQGLLADDPGLRIAMKELPVLGEDSVRAARAALAAHAQGAYVDMHFALLAADDLSIDGIVAVARDLGLDLERLRRDMDSTGVGAHIQANYRLARELGIEGTPAFVVGGEVVPGAVPREQLEALIGLARGE